MSRRTRTVGKNRPHRIQQKSRKEKTQTQTQRQEEELPKCCCQSDDENNDGSSGESKKDDGESTPKRSRVQGGSLGRHVQFSSVIATVSVFNPENSVAPPTTLGPGVPDSGL